MLKFKFVIFLLFLLLNGCDLNRYSGGRIQSSKVVVPNNSGRSFNSSLLTYKDFPKSRSVYALEKYDYDFCKYKCKKLERNYFEINVDYNLSDIIVQKNIDDCWAAASLMLLKHNVKNMNNANFYNKVGEYYSNRKSEDKNAIFRNVINIYKKSVCATPLIDYFFYYSIINNYPVLVGLRAYGGEGDHVVLAIGATFSFRGRDFLDRSEVNMTTYSVKYIDPWDGGVKIMDAEEFSNRADFGISIAPAKIFGKAYGRHLRY